MAAAALPLPDFDEVISEHEIKLFGKRHRRVHVREKIL
jgi:hypothetical protein